MDIVRESSKMPRRKKMAISIVGFVGVLVAGFMLAPSSLTSKSYNRSTLLIAEVQRGDMAVKVFGNGTIVPKEVRWVAANVSGRVNRLLVKPGANVERGDVLVELDNPELLQDAQKRRWELEAEEAELLALEVSLETDVINQNSRVKTVEISLESARFQLDAEHKLNAQVVGTISLIDQKKTQLNVRQLENDLSVEMLRLSRMKKNRDARINAQKARLKSMKNVWLQAQHQVDSLRVVAAHAGVVQDVSVDLGQRLSTGTNLVKMADQNDLIAELKVAERLINDVIVGQRVLIDTRKNDIAGTVVRIDPAVVNGAVLVEVAFSEVLPPEARPDLSISGEILVADLKDTIFVNRPIIAQSEQASVIYKLDEGGDIAHKTSVSYGKGSSDQIQILAGLESGDKIILSDHTGWEHLERIGIK